jgi:hypothetical protein
MPCKNKQSCLKTTLLAPIISEKRKKFAKNEGIV